MQLKPSVSPTRKSAKQLKRTARYTAVDFAIAAGAVASTAAIHALNAPIDFGATVRLMFVVAMIQLTSLYLFGVYRRIWKRSSGHEMTIIINAVFAGSVVITVVMLLLAEQPLPLLLVLFAQGITLIGFVAIRYRSRVLSGLVWRWRAVIRKEFPKLTRVLVIGAGDSGQAFAWRIKHRSKNISYMIIGFIDDDPEKQGMYVEGCRVLGTRQDIERVADSYKIDLIVVAVHNISGPDFREVLTHCERTNAIIKVVPDVLSLVDNTKKNTALLRDVQAEDLLGRGTITRHEAVDLSPVMNKVILITGAAGSIGSELSRQILNYSPTKAILLDNNESGLHDLVTELHTKYPEIELVAALADITIPHSLRAVFDRHHPQIVFHAAAYKHVPMLEYYPQEALRVNIFGTRNLAELAHDFQVERFVLISTDKAVNPSSIMGASKRACELMLHALSHKPETNTLFTSVRFGNVLGSRGSVVPTFNRQIDSGGPVTVTHPEMTRYFMSIPEAVNLIIHAASITQGDDIYILKMGEVVRIVELAERMIRLRGLRPYHDIDIQFTGIRPGEKMHEELFHGLENPQPTIHPNIVQLNTWSDAFVNERFWQQLDAMSDKLTEVPSNPLQVLLDLIQAQPMMTMTQKNKPKAQPA